MRNGSAGTKALTIVALAVTAVLLSCTYAFAVPTASTQTTVAAADDPSAIQTTVDPQTQDFRKQLLTKQADLETLKSQLASMDVQFEIAEQQWVQASEQLKQLNTRVKQAQADIEAARQAYALESEILGKRATSIYKDGTIGGVEVLLDSKSVGDFVARVKFLNTIGLADASAADSLKAQKDLMEAQLAELKSAQQQAASLEFEMKARKIEVQIGIGDRQATMAATQKDLIAMLDSEAAKRQGMESALLKEVLSGANKAGIIVAPGTPVETALAYHGIPYVWAGATPSGFDCSGLMLYVFEQHGVTLPHYSGSQFELGEKVDLSAIQPNDVVFFGNPVHHVGMYCGGGYFIEAPYTGSFVRITPMSSRHDLAGVRRYPWKLRTAPPKGAVSTPGKALKTVH